MVWIFAAVVVLATGQTAVFKSDVSFPTMAMCEDLLPDVKTDFYSYLEAVYSLKSHEIALEVKCAPEERKALNV